MPPALCLLLPNSLIAPALVFLLRHSFGIRTHSNSFSPFLRPLALYIYLSFTLDPHLSAILRPTSHAPVHIQLSVHVSPSFHPTSALQQVYCTRDARTRKHAHTPYKRARSHTILTGLPLNDLWHFDPARVRWTLVPSATPPQPRFAHGLAAAGGRLYVYGGYSSTGRETEIISPSPLALRMRITSERKH